MTKHEKIVKGLEYCMSDLTCNGCPYWDEDNYCDGGDRLKRDAIALLKELLAHIISKDELIQRMKIPVWLETKNGKVYTGWALTYDVQKGMGITGTRMGITDPSGRVHWLNLEDYGSTWRCWTAEPTEEQRKAAEWQ